MMSAYFDVAVIGGGPAGCAAAIALGERGFSIALVEKTQYSHIRIGETLPPAARIPLTRLGVWQRFLEDEHAPSPANISAWGEDQLSESHFIFNPYGNGWHLDRARFDAMLSQAAENAGAHIWKTTRAKDWRIEQGAWRIQLEDSVDICARLVVDATGRAGSFSRSMGAIRQESDRLIGLVILLDSPPASDSGRDNRTLVETVEQGWWYSSFLPNDHAIIAFMTDRDLAPASSRDTAEFWYQQLAKTKFTRERFDVQSVEELNVVTLSACSYLGNPIFGNNWLAAGDAAFAFDPLSSRGICNALESGMRAAESIAEYLCGMTGAFCEYSDWALYRYKRFLPKRHWYYNQERRWSSSEFWKRRQRDEIDDR